MLVNSVLNSDGIFESFEEIEGFANSEITSVIEIDIQNLTPARRNALALRRCANPIALTELLEEIWIENATPLPPFVVGAQKGTIYDLDVEELIFFSENVCKKLIRYIGYRETNPESKKAAMDVFT